MPAVYAFTRLGIFSFLPSILSYNLRCFPSVSVRSEGKYRRVTVYLSFIPSGKDLYLAGLGS